MKNPNEYARLAIAKPIEARSYAELIAACFGFDEPKAIELAVLIETASYTEALAHLPHNPKNKVCVADLLGLVEELRTRKMSAESVKEPRNAMNSVNDITQQAMEIRDKKKEYLLAFFLNARNQLICKEIISIGTLTASLAHPREIFAPAIGKAAASVILVHNHPSGDPSPSEEDLRLTKRIQQAGRILGIELVDHLILAENGSYSFKTAGAL